MSHRLRNAFLLGIVVGIIVAVVRAARALRHLQPALGSPSAGRYDAGEAPAGLRRRTARSNPHLEPTDTADRPTATPSSRTPITAHLARADAHRSPTDTSPPHGDPVAPKVDRDGEG